MKLVAPGEDNGNVVKTAIIKIHIVRKTVVPEINITETKDVTLKHINQVLDMDMDKIFNHKDVQLSKDEFRKTYDLFLNLQQQMRLNNTLYMHGMEKIIKTIH